MPSIRCGITLAVRSINGCINILYQSVVLINMRLVVVSTKKHKGIYHMILRHDQGSLYPNIHISVYVDRAN